MNNNLPQFDMTVFISKFVRLHGELLFQNKQICLAIYGPQCESLTSHLQVRMNEAEMLYFHSKLPDRARGTNSEHLGNVFVFVWTYNNNNNNKTNDPILNLTPENITQHSRIE